MLEALNTKLKRKLIATALVLLASIGKRRVVEACDYLIYPRECDAEWKGIENKLPKIPSLVTDVESLNNISTICTRLVYCISEVGTTCSPMAAEFIVGVNFPKCWNYVAHKDCNKDTFYKICKNEITQLEKDESMHSCKELYKCVITKMPCKPTAKLHLLPAVIPTTRCTSLACDKSMYATCFSEIMTCTKFIDCFAQYGMCVDGKAHFWGHSVASECVNIKFSSLLSIQIYNCDVKYVFEVCFSLVVRASYDPSYCLSLRNCAMAKARCTWNEAKILLQHIECEKGDMFTLDALVPQNCKFRYNDIMKCGYIKKPPLCKYQNTYFECIVKQLHGCPSELINYFFRNNDAEKELEESSQKHCDCQFIKMIKACVLPLEQLLLADQSNGSEKAITCEMYSDYVDCLKQKSFLCERVTMFTTFTELYTIPNCPDPWHVKNGTGLSAHSAAMENNRIFEPSAVVIAFSLLFFSKSF